MRIRNTIDLYIRNVYYISVQDSYRWIELILELYI